MEIRAIQVGAYDSVLEADWAATLESLGIEFTHHPGSLRLSDGRVYEPDFVLTREEILLEVKGNHNERVEKAAIASRDHGLTALIGRVGLVPAGSNVEEAGLVWHNAIYGGTEFFVCWNSLMGYRFTDIPREDDTVFASAERCTTNPDAIGIPMKKVKR